MKTEDSSPIQIVVEKKSDGSHHGGAWKVAYADSVTAMMALFIVLWIFGQSNQIRIPSPLISRILGSSRKGGAPPASVELLHWNRKSWAANLQVCYRKRMLR